MDVSPNHTDVLIIEKWPDAPGWPGRTVLTSATRKARSDDDRFWLVRPKGIFKRWTWLPRAGMFVSIREIQ